MRRYVALLLLLLIVPASPSARQDRVLGTIPQGAPPEPYGTLRSMALTGGVAEVNSLVLTRDRVTMTLTGTLAFAAPVDGTPMGAVFVGRGTMKAETPPGAFERDHIKRLLSADAVESDFTSAVLRWSDDTFAALGVTPAQGPAPEAASRAAQEFESRFTTETGINVAARLALSRLNKETPGVFLAQFDGGRRGRFTYLFDPQGRMPVNYFGINGGEKGLIFQHSSALQFNEVWTAFYALADYQRNAVEYSDQHDLVDVTHYTLDLDLRQFARSITLAGRIDFIAKADGTRAIPFQVGESLSGAGGLGGWLHGVPPGPAVQGPIHHAAG